MANYGIVEHMGTIYMVYTWSARGLNLAVPGADLVNAKSEAGDRIHASKNQQFILATYTKTSRFLCVHCGRLPTQI